jgi:hypothetical protein
MGESNKRNQNMPRIGMNIAELERVLEERRSELSKLARQRSDLEKRLTALDRQMARVGGGSGPFGRRRGRGGRARNEHSLTETIEGVMKGSSKPMKVPDIVNGVLSSGYQSSSANFKGIVNQTLIKDKRFQQVERGVYQLKK